LDVESSNRDSPRTDELAILMRSIEQENYQRERVSYADRAQGTIKDGLSVEEVRNVASFFISTSNPDDLHYRAVFLLSQAMALRGENKHIDIRFHHIRDLVHSGNLLHRICTLQGQLGGR
jgi:hypothetical protein